MAKWRGRKASRKAIVAWHGVISNNGKYQHQLYLGGAYISVSCISIINSLKDDEGENDDVCPL